MAGKSTPTKTVPAAVANPFDLSVVEDVPAPRIKAKEVLPVDDNVRQFAVRLVSARSLIVGISGWDEALVTRFDRTLRSNKSELFPGQRLRIAKGTTSAGKPALRVTLSAGKEETTTNVA